MIWTITKSIGKQLIVMAIIIAISLALMSVNQALGIIIMMLLSSFMVIKSSNKEMPLNKFTALLPGLMSLLIFLIMLALLDVENEIMPLIGIGLGLILGVLMGRGHDVYVKNGILYAKRTFFYVFIWTISILFTQGSTLLGMREVTDFGLLLNGFSTTMMLVLSIILFFKTFKKNTLINNATHGSLLVLLTIIILAIPQTSNARTIHCAPNNEICCFAHAFGTGGPVKFEICMAQGMSFEVDNMPSSPNDSFSFPNDETAAGGIILALLMLLTSLGINTSMLVAQGVATAAMSASQSSVDSTLNVQDTASTSTEDKYGNDNILDGKNATNWMKDHGYLDKETGLPTQKFTDFMNSMPSESGIELQGFAGDLDKNGNPIPMLDEDGNPKRDQNGNLIYDFAIVRDGTPAQQEINKQNDDIKVQKTNTNSSIDDTPTKKDDNLKTDNSDTKLSKDKTTTSPDNNKDLSSNSSPTDDKNKTTSTPKKNEIPPIDYSKVKENFENLMDKEVDKRRSEGYYVRNSHTLQDTFKRAQKRNPDEWKWSVLTEIGWAMDGGWKALNNFGELPAYIHKDLSFHPIDYMIGWKGGQCGDFAEYGSEWSKEKIYEQYGRGTKIDKIIVKSNIYDDRNHAATRITLPNGEKYVLDYWEGIQNDRAAVYTEDEWIDKYKKDFNYDNKGTKTEYEFSDAANNQQHNADLLKQRIDKFGEDDGKKSFLDFIKKTNTKDLPNAKEIVAAWEKRPW